MGAQRPPARRVQVFSRLSRRQSHSGELDKGAAILGILYQPHCCGHRRRAAINSEDSRAWKVDFQNLVFDSRSGKKRGEMAPATARDVRQRRRVLQENRRKLPFIASVHRT